MSAMLHRRTMTEAEFLAWAEPLEARHEFDGTGPVAMVGSTLGHAIMQANLLALLRGPLLGSVYRAIGSDTFTRASCSLRLPDAVVIGGAPKRRSRVIDAPVVVFEILSESTARVDRFTKAREYWATPSIRHYVMLEQEHIGAVVLSRGGAESWTRAAVEQGETIKLPAIGVRLGLTDIYEGVDFDDP